MEIPILFERKNGEEQLKHLGFVLSATLLALACLSKLYEYLKQHSGSLRPIVVSLEGRLIALVGPFDKEHKRLYGLLLLADDQVDKVTTIIDTYGPNFAKKIMNIVHWGFETTEELCDETRKGGIHGVTFHVGIKLALFVMTQSMKLLVKLGHFPALPMLPGMPLPSGHFPALPMLPGMPLPKVDINFSTAAVEDAIEIRPELTENVTDIAGKAEKDEV